MKQRRYLGIKTAISNLTVETITNLNSIVKKKLRKF